MSLIHYQDIVLDNTSKPVPNATVAVYNTGTQTFINLFSDAAGTQPLTNPVTTDSFGRFSFYLNTGTVDITITGTNIFSYSATGVTVGNQATTLEGFTWEAPGTIGSTTPNTGAFSILSATTLSATTLSATTASIKSVGNILYADQFSGADIGAKINAAAAALGSSGGVIIIPAGTYSYSTTINFDQLRDITLQGAGGQTAGAAAATALTYTGAGTAISARSSTSIRILGLQIVWNNAAIAGPVVDFSHVVASDSSWAEIAHCSFFGSGGISVPIVIQLDKTINSSIHDNTIQNYGVGISGASGSGSYSNVIRIEHNTFSSSVGTAQTAHIQNPGQAWVITNNTFEMGSGAGFPFVIGYTGGASSTGVTITGNWIGDSGSTSDIYIQLTGSGFYVSGNYIAGAAANTTTAISISSSTYGVTIQGNKIVNHSIGVSIVGSNRQIHISGNDIQSVTTPISGTPVSGYIADFGNNDSVSIRTVGTGTLTFNGGAVPAVAVVRTFANQSADIASTTVLSPSVDGFYRVSGYIVLTQAGSGGGQLPGVSVQFSDRYTTVSSTVTLCNSNPTNTVGSHTFMAPATIAVKAGSFVNVSTSGYGSSGFTSMTFTCVLLFEFLGS